MGQRHQYIVNFPAKNMGEGNPNNCDARTKVIHHQWLYGANAIFALDRVLTLVKNVVNDKDYMFGTDQNGYANGEGINAIAAAISVDPSAGYYHDVHIFDEKFSASNPLLPDHLDNNDGITVIQFHTGDKKPSVCFATPNHIEGPNWNREDKAHGPFTPTEYLNFYYTEEDRAQWDNKSAKQTEKALASIKRNSRPMTREMLSKLLPGWDFR